MPKWFESSVEALLPNALYLTALLVALALWAARSPARGRLLRSVLAALAIWAWALSTPGLARLGISNLEFIYPKVELSTLGGSDDIVVLASGSTELFGHQPVARLDAPAFERIRAGAALWKQAGGKRLLIIGGPRIGSVSPSAEMANVATGLGVPAQAIVVDDRALTTREGFDLLDPQALNLTPGAWLVTSAIHMPRAMQAAARRGLALRPFPCDYLYTDSPGWRQWIPGTMAYRLNIELLHELVGMAYYSFSSGG